MTAAVARRIVCCFVLASTAAVGVARAQLNTQHLKGDAGLKAGSQPPPHTYVMFPLLSLYATDTVRNKAGTKLPLDASITTALYAAKLTVVTEKKIFGGMYGFQVLFPAWANNRLQGTEIESDPGAGLTDSVVQPISLGWRRQRADVLTSYTIYVPTGRYDDGARTNTGFGMWGHEVSGGATVYLTGDRRYHAATLASVSFQSRKEDSETKVGNMLVLEGGAGADFGQGLLTAGLAYNAGFKLSDDRIDGLPEQLAPAKNKSFALGPEITFAFESNGNIYAFVKVNVEWEIYARNTTQGHVVQISATMPVGPVRLPRQ